jgi:hypothetical protein
MGLEAADVRLQAGLSWLFKRDLVEPALAPVFDWGSVVLLTDARWLNEYVKELVAFPRGKHDDQVGSTSQFLSWITTRPDLSVRQSSF